jgi:tetratricopeptide (TPR) repeat protein
LVIGALVATWQAVRARQAEQRAVAALVELRKTAVAFVEEARLLVAQSRFEEAVAKLEYAIKLRPEEADYLVTKADLLQCQLKLAEAARSYQAALKLDPRLDRAKTNLKLTEELLQSAAANSGKIHSNSLSALLTAMRMEQRSAAELFPVATLLGEEKPLMVDYWLDRLKDLPIPADRPLKARLALKTNGRLQLDLSGTAIDNLAPLKDMPLGYLKVSGCPKIKDLSPLRGLPLEQVDLTSTAVSDLSALRDVPTLKDLDISQTSVTNLSPLRGLQLVSFGMSACEIPDISPLRGMPLERLTLWQSPVVSLAPLRGMPLKHLDLAMIPAQDFDVLAGMPVEDLILNGDKVRDLGFLKGMPLRHLSLGGCTDARKYSALREINTLELLALPPTYLRLPSEDLAALASLRQFSSLRQVWVGSMNGLKCEKVDGSKPGEDFWQDLDTTLAVRTGRWDALKALLAKSIESARTNHSRLPDRTLDAIKEGAKQLSLLERFSEAATLWRVLMDERMARDPQPRAFNEETIEWIQFAAILVASGNTAGYQSAAREMVRRYQELPPAMDYLATRILKVSSWGPDSGVSPEELKRFVKMAEDYVADGKNAQWILPEIAISDYRAGALARADERLSKHKVAGAQVTGVYAHTMLAMVYFRQGRHEPALEQLREARSSIVDPREMPDAWHDWINARTLLNEAEALIGHHNYGSSELARSGEDGWQDLQIALAVREGRWDDAQAILARAIEKARTQNARLAGSTLKAMKEVARRLCSVERFPEAATLWRVLIDERLARDPEPRAYEEETIEWIQLAAILVASGNTAEYQRAAREVIQRYRALPASMDYLGTRIVKVCSFGRDSGVSPAELDYFVKLAEASMAGDGKEGLNQWVIPEVAMSDYRAGAFTRAEERLAKHSVFSASVTGVFAQTIRAMLDSRQGRHEAAREHLREARRGMADAGDTRDQWHDWLIARTLLNEAEGLIQKRNATTSPPDRPASAPLATPQGKL